MSCIGRRRKSKLSAHENEGEDADSIHWRPIIVVAMMLFIDGLGYCMSLAPQTQLLEDIVCRQYYKVENSGPIGRPSEKMCKDPAVQDVVANLFGWQTFFDGIPGLVLAIWFGVLADKQGRRRVFFLSVVGQILGACWVLFICRSQYQSHATGYHLTDATCRLGRAAPQTYVAVLDFSHYWRREHGNGRRSHDDYHGCIA